MVRVLPVPVAMASRTFRWPFIYNIKGLEDKDIDRETRIQIATVQSMVKRILYNDEDTMPAVSDYDLVIIDEAHRGYIPQGHTLQRYRPSCNECPPRLIW